MDVKGCLTRQGIKSQILEEYIGPYVRSETECTGGVRATHSIALLLPVDKEGEGAILNDNIDGNETIERDGYRPCGESGCCA